MKALVYLFLVRLKNQIKELFKSPAKVILLIFIIATFVALIFSGNSVGAYGENFRDIKEMYAIIFALYNFIFFTVSYGGLSKGGTLFSMADVNFLFTSPIKSVVILFYGLIQQIGTSLLLGIFILYQYGWLHGLYGIEPGFLVIILLGYAITLFCAQFTAMFIY